MYVRGKKDFFVWHDSFEKYGTGYAEGTVIKLSQNYIDKQKLKTGKKLYKYARYSHTYSKNGKYEFVFFSYVSHLDDECRHREYKSYYESEPHYGIPEEDIEEAIEEIVKQVTIPLVKKTKKKDSECEEVLLGWVLYVLALFGSLIFREWYLVWTSGTFFFFVWRNIKLWED